MQNSAVYPRTDPPGQSSEGDQVAVYGQAGPGRDTGIHRARRILSCRFSAGQCWTENRIIPDNQGFILPDFSGLHDGSRKKTWQFPSGREADFYVKETAHGLIRLFRFPGNRYPAFPFILYYCHLILFNTLIMSYTDSALQVKEHAN